MIKKRLTVLLFIFSFSRLIYASDIIPNQYIVVLKKQSVINTNTANRMTTTGETIRQTAERLINEAEQNQLQIQNKGITTSTNVTNTLGLVYENTIQGFSAVLTPEGVDYLKQDPLIDYVEPDTVMTVNAVQQPVSSWGMDRIDQRNLPLSNSYEYNLYGSGVHAYIIDTGIWATHNEFTGRIGLGIDFIDGDNSPNDCHTLGHGTHVAGTVGGNTYGVAKGVTIHAIKVLGCDGRGPTSGVIAGVDWVSSHAVFPAVANMSLGGSANQALDSAVNNAVASGITFIVAAGNENGSDACNRSPAGAADAITVASIDSNNSRSSFSNIGSCVDIFAPGRSIVSATNTSDTASITLSGTSMASPHVAGVAALLLEAHSSFTPAQVTSEIIDTSTVGVVSNAGSGTPNRLVYSLLTKPVTPPPSPLPAVPNLYAPSSVHEYSTFSVSWSSVNSATRYELQRYHNDSWSPGYKKWTTISNSAVLSISLGSGRQGFQQFRVRACNSSGCSAYSSVKFVSIYK